MSSSDDHGRIPGGVDMAKEIHIRENNEIIDIITVKEHMNLDDLSNDIQQLGMNDGWLREEEEDDEVRSD